MLTFRKFRYIGQSPNLYPDYSRLLGCLQRDMVYIVQTYTYHRMIKPVSEISIDGPRTILHVQFQLHVYSPALIMVIVT